MINHIRVNSLQPYLEDNTKARIMNADGTYTRLHPDKGQEPVNVQSLFLAQRRKGNGR